MARSEFLYVDTQTVKKLKIKNRNLVKINYDFEKNHEYQFEYEIYRRNDHLCNQKTENRDQYSRAVMTTASYKHKLVEANQKQFLVKFRLKCERKTN